MFCAATIRECREVLANENIDLVFSDRCLADGTYRDVLVIMRLLGLYISMIVTSRLRRLGRIFRGVCMMVLLTSSRLRAEPRT